MASSIVLSDNGVTSGSAGIKSTGGNDGVLLLQTTTSGGTATTAVTVDNAQNVGIGTSSPAANKKLAIYSNVNANAGITVTNVSTGSSAVSSMTISNSSTEGQISKASTTFSSYGVIAAEDFYLYSGSAKDLTFAADGGNIKFGTGSGNPERARIDSSGNLLVGATSAATNVAGLWMFNQSGTNGRVNIIKTSSGTSSAVANYYNGTYVGGLDYSNTATIPVASSDERLKKNIVEAPSALDKAMAIEVVSYDWKHDPTHVEFGFIAQRLNTVYPEAVIVGDNNEEIEKTWGVEYGRLTPMLIKALQEQQALIQSLTDRLTALEGAAK